MHLRTHDVVDPLVGVVDVLGIFGNRHHIEEQQRAALGHQHFNVLLGLALLGLVFAGIYDLIITSREKSIKTETSSTITEYDSEEELDL